IRSYPQPEFSLAKRTMSASRSDAMRGRPGEVRSLEPSNLRAMSRRYQARMVSAAHWQPAEAQYGRVAYRSQQGLIVRDPKDAYGREVGLGGCDSRLRGIHSGAGVSD